MIEFVSKNWQLLTTFAGVFLYMYRQIAATRRGIRALLRADLIRLYNKYHDDLGYCPLYIKQALEEEYKEYEKANDIDTLDSSETLKENLKTKSRVRISKWYHGVDWLIAHHFDYRGLIEKGLAIAVTEENNPYKD